jgi:hypothetical protein
VKLTPVEFDPFEGQAPSAKLTPVDYDPFAAGPAAAPAEPGPLDRLADSFRGGVAQMFGGPQQMIGETLAGVMDMTDIGAIIGRATGADVAPNPITQAATDFGAQGAGVAEIGRGLTQGAQAGIAPPESIMDALARPGDTSQYYGNVISQSLPLMLGAMATRSPQLGSMLMGVGSGGQTFSAEREGGAGLLEALQQAGTSGAIEAALGQAPLETAFGARPLPSRAALASAQEAGTEAVTGGAQELASAGIAGREVDDSRVARSIIDSMIAGAAMGPLEAVLGGSGERAPVQPVAAPPQPAAPTDLAPEPTGDLESILDAMLAPDAPILTNAEKQQLRDAGVPPGEIARMSVADARARLGDIPGDTKQPQAAPAQAQTTDIPQGLGDFLSQTLAAQPFQSRQQPEAATSVAIDPTPQPGPKPDNVAAPENLDTSRRWVPMKGTNGQVLTDAQGRPKRKPVLDYDKGDGLRGWLAAEGGINFEELRAYAGADPALRGDSDMQYPFGMKNWPTLRKGDQGMGLETLIERMRDTGWLNENELDMADAADMVMRAINGEQIFHPFEGAGARLARDAEQGWEAAQDKATQELAPIGETSGRVDAMAERQALRDQDREESLTLADQAKRWAATNPAPAEPAPMFRRKDVEPSPPVDSPAWQAFTADTKVRDPQGKVIPLYHGTGEDFSVFDDAKAGDSTQHTTAPLGHFLTPNRELAEGYARNASDGRPADERVVEAWVQIKNPYTMTLEDMQAIDSPESARAVRGWLQSQGHDGIHVPDADNWIAFESGQIKDVANAGTFDRANPDIRFSRNDATLRRADADAQPEAANGIPQNLPAAQTEATRTLARRINGFLGGNAQFRAQEVAQDSLPDALAGALDALGKATGTRTVVFRNLTPGVYDFNGVTFRDGVIYVNEAAPAPATTLAAHEFVHDLRKQAPELYAELEAEVQRQGRVSAFARKLKRDGDPNAKANALEELTADAVGDALTDRTFLERMAKESGELFKRVADAFLAFLDSITGRVRDLGSNAYLADVQAFRDVLADVLKRYEAGRAGEGGAPKFSRAAAVGSPEFRQWFGDSKVVDANGNPLVVYHGTPSKTAIDSFNADNGGVFFTSDEKTAGEYTGARGMWQSRSTGSVQSAYLAMKNPLIIDALGKRHDNIPVPWQQWKPKVYGNLPANAVSVEKALDYAKRNGHDGLIVRNVVDSARTDGKRASDVFAVVAADQIKSADNTGAFGQRPVTAKEAEGAGLTEAEANEAQARGDIRFSRKTPQQAEQEATQRRAQVAATLPQRQGTPGWNYDRSVWEGRSGQLKNARAVLQDKMTAWADVQKQIESQLGTVIPDAQNVYRLENLMHGRVREALDRQERAQVVPLVEAMRAAKVKPAELEEYLYARHAQERNAEIAKINPRMPDGGSGMTNAEAAEILSKADKAKLDPLAAMADRMTRGTRNRLLAHGLITQDQFDAMDSQYGSYVPLRGKTIHPTEAANIPTTAGRGVDGRRSPVREALGRGAGNRALNILAEVIGDAQRSIIMAEKARVGRAAMRLVLANPNPDLWTVEPVQTEFKKDANGEVYEAVINDWSDPTVVAVRVKGQVYKIQMNLPLAQALTNVGVDQINAVIRFAGAINRYLSAVLTKYNPAFMGVNASRDIIFGLTGLASEHGEMAAIDAAVHYPQAILAAGRQAAGKGGSGQWDTWANEFAEAGGKTGYVNMPSVEDLHRMIGTGRLSSYSPTGVARVVRGLTDVVGVMNDAVENALRLSAYVTLRKRGMSQDKAAEYAKNLTVNFNRKGSAGTWMNAVFLFYNAATQGAMRVGNVLRKPKAWGYLGSLVALQTVAQMFAMGLEDDDGEPLWNKIPDHVKRRNIVIVTPDKGVITIPMPYGFNWFVYAPSRVLDAIMSKDPSAKNGPGSVTGDLTSALVEAFSPMPLNDDYGFLPTVLRYPVNMTVNRNDFGNPIRREDPYAKSDLPRSSMGHADTLEVFKLAATGLNRLGGGDDYTPPVPLLDFAPEDLEYMLKTATGGAGGFVVDVATLGQKAAGEFPLEARDVPLSKRFYQGINEEASQQALFYQRRETIDRSLRRVRDAFKGKGEDEAQKLLDASPELAGAVFRRNKRGEVVVSSGSPQIVPEPGSLFELYRDTEKAVRARSAEMKRVYDEAPASILPNAATRERERKMRAENIKRMEAQRAFNAAWTRVVVSAAD